MNTNTGSKELNALINLLDEPDERAFLQIRDKIISFGDSAIPVLERSWEVSLSGPIHERIDDIIRDIRKKQVFHDFTNWLHTGSSDLLRGYLLVSRIQFPGFNEDEVVRTMEKLRLDTWLEMNDSLTALENVKVLNHILYQVHRFEGNKINLLAPENFYLHSLLKNRLGSPLSLGMLYTILAQKLLLPVFGVNLPQHFILAYANEMTAEIPSPDDVLFYINPFNRGAVFTRKEIELFIRQMKISSELRYFSPCSNTEILQRLLETLVFINNQAGIPEKNEPLEGLLTLIRPS